MEKNKTLLETVRVIIVDDNSYLIDALQMIITDILQARGYTAYFLPKNAFCLAEWVITSKTLALIPGKSRLYTLICDHQGTDVSENHESQSGDRFYRYGTVDTITRHLTCYLSSFLAIREKTQIKNLWTEYIAHLSNTEKKVLPLLIKGFTPEQIANRMERSSKTIYIHRKNIVSQLGFSNTLHFRRWLSIYTD